MPSGLVKRMTMTDTLSSTQVHGPQIFFACDPVFMIPRYSIPTPSTFVVHARLCIKGTGFSSFQPQSMAYSTRPALLPQDFGFPPSASNSASKAKLPSQKPRKVKRKQAEGEKKRVPKTAKKSVKPSAKKSIKKKTRKLPWKQ